MWIHTIRWIHVTMWIHTIRWIHFIMWIHTIRWIHVIIYKFRHQMNSCSAGASPLWSTYLACHWHQEKSCKYTRQTGVLLEPLLDLTLSKSKLDIAVRTSNCMHCKKWYCDCMYHGNCEMRVMAAIAIG